MYGTGAGGAVAAELGSGGGGLELFELSARWTVERTNSGVSILSRWVRKRLRQGGGLLLLAMMFEDDEGCGAKWFMYRE